MSEETNIMLFWKCDTEDKYFECASMADREHAEVVGKQLQKEGYCEVFVGIETEAKRKEE